MNPENITTYEQCLELHGEEKVEKRLLMPEIFGGLDEQYNQIFLPLGLGEAVDSFNRAVSVILENKQEGQEIEYKVTPEWKGDSFIPGSIATSAYLVDGTSGGKVGGGIDGVIEIW